MAALNRSNLDLQVLFQGCVSAAMSKFKATPQGRWREKWNKKGGPAPTVLYPDSWSSILAWPADPSQTPTHSPMGPRPQQLNGEAQPPAPGPYQAWTHSLGFKNENFNLFYKQTNKIYESFFQNS